VIHADAGWPRARDEREPMCGEPGGERRVNPSADPRARSRGEEGGARGRGAGCLCLGAGFCAATAAGNELPVPSMPQFPRCEDGEMVARVPCWDVGFGGDPGESSAVQTAKLQPCLCPSASGRLDFSLVLLGLNTRHSSLAGWPCSAGRGRGPLRLGAVCSPLGTGSSPSPAPCTHTLGQLELLPPAAPCPWGLLPGAGLEPEVAPPAAPAGGSTEIRHSCARSPKFPAHPSAGITWGIPRKPLPADGFQHGQGTGPPRASPPGAVFCRAPGGRP